MGSMIQVGLSVKTLGAPAATDSSPMKLQSYNHKPILHRWGCLSVSNVCNHVCVSGSLGDQSCSVGWAATDSPTTVLTCEWGTFPWWRWWWAAPLSGQSLWPGQPVSSSAWHLCHSAAPRESSGSKRRNSQHEKGHYCHLIPSFVSFYSSMWLTLFFAKMKMFSCLKRAVLWSILRCDVND